MRSNREISSSCVSSLVTCRYVFPNWEGDGDDDDDDEEEEDDDSALEEE
jgi:hypothetical protein